MDDDENRNGSPASSFSRNGKKRNGPSIKSGITQVMNVLSLSQDKSNLFEKEKS